MKIEYRSHTIDVMAIRNDSFWTAEVCIESVIGGPTPLRENGEIDGAGTLSDAEVAGIEWGKYRIDLYLLSTL